MPSEKLQFAKPVTLVGGGDLQQDVLRHALEIAPSLVAADGAADRVAAIGYHPDAIVGDMDSIADLESWHDSPTTVIHLAEQDTTDFEKCLYSIDAPCFVCVGFTGRRVDHTLAAFHVMQRHAAQNIVLLSNEDVIAMVPEHGLEMPVAPGARVSFYPLVPVKGIASRGLRWSIEGLQMEVGLQIGTSNIAEEAEISVRFDRRGALVVLDQSYVRGVIAALN